MCKLCPCSVLMKTNALLLLVVVLLKCKWQRCVIDVNTLTAESRHTVIVLFQVQCVEARRQNNIKYHCPVTDRLHCLSPFFFFFSIYSSIEEKENNSDGASLYFSVSNSRTAQRDGRFHAGAGGCPATKVDGPWEGNAEQSYESAGSHAWKDQPAKPWETSWTCGQDTLEVPFTFSTFRSLTDTSCVSGEGI